MDEIFYEVKEIKNQTDLKSEHDTEIILHFLAKVDQNTILYETKQKVSKMNDISIDQEVIRSLDDIFHQVDSSLKLVKGKIREIFLSYSS